MKIIVKLLILLFLFSGCAKEIIDPPDDEIITKPMGTLQIKFETKHYWIPARRLIRSELHLAKTVGELYRGEYFISANVMDSKELYVFQLEPGNYYYEAVISCICGGDSCSAGVSQGINTDKNILLISLQFSRTRLH